MGVVRRKRLIDANLLSLLSELDIYFYIEKLIIPTLINHENSFKEFRNYLNELKKSEKLDQIAFKEFKETSYLLDKWWLSLRTLIYSDTIRAEVNLSGNLSGIVLNINEITHEYIKKDKDFKFINEDLVDETLEEIQRILENINTLTSKFHDFLSNGFEREEKILGIILDR